jgi:inhibitor of cysteine peptidase
MNKISLLLPLIFLFLLSVKSSFSQIEVFTANDTNITVTAGEQFSILLESNPATGYNWSVRIPEGAEKIMIINSEYAKSNSGKFGEGGEQLWRFKALSSGNVKLELSYIRAWEKEEPAKVIAFNVKVE